MNRRNFFGTLLTATAGFTILPGAGRIWKALDARCILVTPCNYNVLTLWLNEESRRLNGLPPALDAWTNLLKVRRWSSGMGTRALENS